MPLLIDGRGDVHSGEPSPHVDCPDPATCDCDCPGCKRVWERAGRPSPSPREIGVTAIVSEKEICISLTTTEARAVAHAIAPGVDRRTIVLVCQDCGAEVKRGQHYKATGCPTRPGFTEEQADRAAVDLLERLPMSYAPAHEPNTCRTIIRDALLQASRSSDVTARDLLRRARIRLVNEPLAKELDAEIVAFLGKCPGATTNGSQRCTREQNHKGRCFDGKRVFVSGDPPVTGEASYAEARDAQKFKE